MLILLHVTVALLSMIYTSLLLVVPRQAGFKVAYGLVGLTLASGTYLVISLRTHILETCISGLAYLAAVTTGLALAKYRLAKQTSKNIHD